MAKESDIWHIVLCHPIGYVGAATVGAATWWFIAAEDGPRITIYQLVRNSPYISIHNYFSNKCILMFTFSSVIFFIP